jgi:type II secretion system protein G
MVTRRRLIILSAVGVLSLGPGLMAIRHTLQSVFGYGVCGHPPETYVQSDGKLLQSALMMFRLNARRLPTQVEGLEALVTRPATLPADARWVQIMTRVPNDPWANPYLYQTWTASGIENVRISSTGPDPSDPSDDIAETFSFQADHAK